MDADCAMGTYRHPPPLSPGEAGFLWWFIQGSIMEPDVRRRLHDGWGMCPRHAFAYLSVEATFRHQFMHGPAILYADLVSRGLAAFRIRGPGRNARIGERLRSKGPCHMCELGYGPDSTGFVRRDRLALARETRSWLEFLIGTRQGWNGWVCGRCAGAPTLVRCRPHLVEELSGHVATEMELQRKVLEALAGHLSRYERSFMWDFRGTAGEDDRAALVGAVGWCTGWRPFLDALVSARASDQIPPKASIPPATPRDPR